MRNDKTNRILSSRRKFWQIIVYAVLLPCISGCSVFDDITWENITLQEVNLDVLEPAASPLSNNIQSVIIVIPKYDSTKYNFIYHINNGAISIEDDKYIGDIIYDNYDKMISLLADSPRLDSLLVFNDELPGISEQDVQTLCETNNADAIIFADSVSVQMKFSPLIVNYYYYYSEYYYDVEVSVSFVWNIYSRWNPKGERKIITEEFKTRMETYESNIKNVLSSNDIPYLVNKINTKLGEKFAKSIVPTWKQTKRILFSYGNKDIRKAAFLCNENKFDEAISLWRKNIDNTKQVVSKHARFNMILGHEIEGNIDSSLICAKKYHDDFGDENSLVYIRILETRVETDKLISEQLQKK